MKAGGREIAFDNIRSGQIRVLHVGRQIGEPARLLELALLHVIAEVDNVEARLARGQFDDDLLALLLFRYLLRFNLDAGQLSELAGVFLQVVAARSLGQDHFELRSGEFLPLRLGGARRKSREPHHSSRGRARKNGTTRHMVLPHGCFSPAVFFL